MDANSLAFFNSDFIKLFYSPEYYGRRNEMPLLSLGTNSIFYNEGIECESSSKFILSPKLALVCLF